MRKGKTEGLIIAYLAGGILAATAIMITPCSVLAAEPGSLHLSPADVADSQTTLAMADQPDAAAAPKEEKKVEETTEAAPAAPAAWPPGLIMKGLDAVGIGKPMGDIGLRAYGYIEVGMTGVIHGPGSSRLGLPLRVFDSRKPGNLRMNQLKFTLDRVVDMTKSFDIGGRADFVLGTDPRVWRMAGFMDKQNHDIQPDLQQFYGEMWIKTGGDNQGFDIIFGRWATTLGAEVMDAPGNYLYSRSLLYGFAIPFAHTGLKVSYYLDANNSFYGAVVRGWDVFNDNNDGATFMGGFLLSSCEQTGALPKSQVAFNMIGGPELTGADWPGNRIVLDVIWTYRWTEKLTQVVNADYGTQDDAPNTVDDDGQVGTRDSDWWGVAYYLNYVFNDYVNATVRAEWFYDQYGSRTGFQGNFYEVTTGVTITPFPCDAILKDLSFRPEIRWDWSANNKPINGEDSQITAAFDVIYKF